MNITKKLILFLLIGQSTLSSAQFTTLSSNLFAQGEMPDDFKKVYSQKFYETLNDDEVQKLKNKNQGKEFAAMTNYSIDHLLKSGRVVYNDPITIYCNKIIAHLLSVQEKSDRNIRLYTLKSNDVNAYSTHQGIIIITTGLISRLENEAQLAFVLAHEIAHVLQNHNVESFSYNSELFKKDVSNRHNDLEEKILKSSKHSKKSEFEADNDGWDMYIKAGYSPSAVIPVFDILLYAYLPLTQKTFPYSEVEFGGYEIPDKAKEYKLDSITVMEDVDDSQSSHPNIRSRKENIASKLGNLSTKRTDFGLYNQNEFMKVRSLAYQESIYQHIIHNEYVEALIMLDTIPSGILDLSTFKYHAKAMCYYGIQAFTNNSERSEVVERSKHQGVQGSYYHLFLKLKMDELNVLCIRQLSMLKQLQPDSKMIDRLMYQGMFSMQQQTKFDWDYFGEITDSNSLKKKNRKCHTCHQAFAGLNNTDKLKTYYDYVVTPQNVVTDESAEHTNKLIMFSPRYVLMDSRTKINNQFLNTERKQQYLEDQIVTYGKQLDIDVKVIDSWKNGTMTTEEYNEYSVFMDWMIERSGYSGKYFRGFLAEDVGKLSDKMGSKYLGFSMYWNLLEHKRFNFWYFAGSALTLYLFPLYVKWQFTPYHLTGYTFTMINSENGYFSYVDTKTFDVKYRNYLIKSHIYNSLIQIAK